MKKKLLQQSISVIILILTLTSFSYAQCTDCTVSYGEGSNVRVDLNGNQNICITGNSTMTFGNINGSNNKVCIAPGVSWNTSTNMFSNLVIDVYGTMQVSSLAGNGKMVINVHKTGKLIFSGTSIPRDFTINNYGILELTSDNTISVEAKINNQTPTSRIIAKAGNRTLLKFHQNMVDNHGIIEVMNLENSDTKGFENRSTGQIVLQGVLYQHGILSNRGRIETQCGVTVGVISQMVCGMLVGDKGATSFKNEGGSITIKGNLVVNGQINMEGGSIVVNNGSVNINKPLTGSGGSLRVTDGEANVNNGGFYGNTNKDQPDMTLYVSRTPNHNFNTIAPSQTGNYYRISGDSALPVNLISFTAKNQEGIVVISWSTSDESDSEKFEVEQSSNATNWTKVGEKVSNNLGQVLSKYELTLDKINQTTYYRLKMIDVDGSYTYSTIRSIWVGQVAESFIYPNPTSDKFYIRANESDSIKKVFVYDLSGKVVLTPALQNNAIDVQTLPSGQYLIRVVNADGTSKSFKSAVNR